MCVLWAYFHRIKISPLVATIFRSFSGNETSNWGDILDFHAGVPEVWGSGGTVSRQTKITKQPFNLKFWMPSVTRTRPVFPVFAFKVMYSTITVNSVLWTIKPCPHCRRKVRLSHKSETVAENGDKTATVSLFCDATVALFCDSVDRALTSCNTVCGGGGTRASSVSMAQRLSMHN